MIPPPADRPLGNGIASPAGGGMTSELAIELKSITKKFGNVLANDAAQLAVQKGEIHALIGENGAGKSTLMKILYGLYHPDAGEIFVHGKPVRFSGPKDAIRAGIGMVHQHFMLVPTLTVAENVVLAEEPKYYSGLLFDRVRAEQEVAKLSSRYGLALEPRAKVSDLSVGQEQRLEILKVLYRGAEILILDEPTAVLTPQETLAFFEILKTLRSQGKTVILITHKLQEVISISQTITVMRQGKTVGRVQTAKTSESELAQMMVGRPVLFQVKRNLKSLEEIEKSPVILKLENVSAASDRGLPALQNVSLEVHQGEIFGIAGVEGNGQTELVEVLSGLRRPSSGKIYFQNSEIAFHQANPRKFFELGLAHVPEDRHKRGLVLDYSVSENLIFGRHREPAFSTPCQIFFSEIRKFSERMVQDYDIRPANVSLKVKSFSGGNQQKVVVARELSRSPKLLLASQPTRGVDVGAIELIHKKMIEARDGGAGIFLISAELSEILSLSDRIGVIYRGQIVTIFPIQAASEEKLGLLMTGGKND